MAINKNHEFEDLQGVKCAIVERNVSQERVGFLKNLLELNKYTVVVVPGAAPKPAPQATDAGAEVVQPVQPANFIVGVTDVAFNTVNAVFGRSLKTKDGHVVSRAYWRQEEVRSQDEIPYFEKKRYSV